MSYYNQPFLDDWARPANKNDTRFKIGAIQYKIDDQFQNWHTKYKNGDQTENWHKPIENGTSQIQNWHKRSFYQGPGVKFPFSWEKITLPPGVAMAFCMLKTTPLFTRRKNFLKIFKKYVDFCFYMLIILSSNQAKRVAVHSQKGGLIK